MGEKLRVGMIGAGTIARYHIDAYRQNPNVELVSICSPSGDSAQKLAHEYGIPSVYTDHLDILRDPSVDAVSIVSPTYTHKSLVLEALKYGKHILCEKPPALNVTEAEECCQAAAKSDKVLMYGFVVRFYNHMQFLKQHVDSGAMGEIYYADLTRMERCLDLASWFADKEKSGGGNLMDGAIHEIDSALYLMGYPKIKSVKGYSTNRLADLPDLVNAINPPRKRTVEAAACALVTFENGACLCVKTSSALLTPNERITIELCGTKAGVAANVLSGEMKLVSIDDSNCLMESVPVLEDKTKPFYRQINHFVDCCLNGTECICKPWQAVEVMKIISAIYESAETGNEIKF